MIHHKVTAGHGGQAPGCREPERRKPHGSRHGQKEVETLITDAKMSVLKNLHGDMNRLDIQRYDEEWTAATARIKNSRINLKNIPIVPKSKEYPAKTANL